MKYIELSRFLKRKQVEISTQRGYLVSQKELAEDASTPEYPIGQRSMGHWFNGSAMPESWFWPGLYRVFGHGLYAALGHPELEPEELDPELREFIGLYQRAKTDPNSADVLRKMVLQAQAQLNNKIVRNEQVTFGT